MKGLDFSHIAKVEKQVKDQTSKPIVAGYDSASGSAAELVQKLEDRAFDNELLELRRFALFAVLQLADDIISGDLEDDELPSDRLDVYLHPDIIADEDNQTLVNQYVQIRAANMSDAMMSLGVSAELIDLIFGDDIEEADSAIESAAEIIEVNMPSGDDLEAFVRDFLFGGELDMEAGQLDGFDSAEVGKTKVRKTKAGQTLVYRGVKAVRHGKVVVVNKRVGNTMMKVKLSPKQKAALRRALSKANTGGAIARRLRSLAVGHKANIYKKNNGL